MQSSDPRPFRQALGAFPTGVNVLRFEHCEREPLVFKRGRFALAVEK